MHDFDETIESDYPEEDLLGYDGFSDDDAIFPEILDDDFGDDSYDEEFPEFDSFESDDWSGPDGDDSETESGSDSE